MHRASRRLLFHFYRVAAACGGAFCSGFLDRFIDSGVFFVGCKVLKSLRTEDALCKTTLSLHLLGGADKFLSVLEELSIREKLIPNKWASI